MNKSTSFFSILMLFGIFTGSFLVLPPPPGGISAYANDIFPSTTPGAGSSWGLEDPMPGLTIDAPLRIINFPNTEDLLVLNKGGEIWQVSLENRTKDLILDITDRSFKLGEAGTTGMVLHPKFGLSNFPNKQEIFIFYRSKPEPDIYSQRGFNRLSKFKWDPDSGTFDLSSEEILFQQYDRSTWHNGGGLFFDNDGFLYVSLGDEGKSEFQLDSSQKLDGGFFSGIIRIDVDNDPSRSHPIRRQPIVNAAPPSAYDGWETFSQGYSIPNDNPWLSPDSTHLEEFYAIGLRSPYSIFYDKETGDIWEADVGSDIAEEINKIEYGDNLQWPYIEGDTERPGIPKPINIIGQEKGAFFHYDRSVGNCIIGGGIYRGTVFPNLNGKYLFADYAQDKLMVLSNTNSSSTEDYEVMISGLNNPNLELPVSPRITGIHIQDNGEILVTVMGEDFSVPGKILRLKQNTFVADPPAYLSELGVFEDLENLVPIKGFIPYRVNSPLWSDRAIKKRWIAIPNDGTYDTPDEQIVFNGATEWKFPQGTVFIKHFDLPTTTDAEGPTRRLETRFFIIGEDQIGYGLTYIWNEEETDALLAGGGTSKDFEIYENGMFAYTQTWDYPGRDQCMTCHNSNAKFVLGVKTHQLNGDLDYPTLNDSKNQIQYLDELGIFTNHVNAPENYLKAHPIDDENIDLESRVRSYLDANCSSCHRLGGTPNVTMDLRYTLPLQLQGLINLPVNSEVSPQNSIIVKPGDHAASELWIRDASQGTNKMPPLARSLQDEIYLDKLAEWIDGLSEDAGDIDNIFIYPNPSFGQVYVQFRRAWEPPFEINIYAMSGQLIGKHVAESHLYNLDLSRQPSGIYLLELNYNGERQMQKILLTNNNN